MALADSTKVDFLWKKLGFGVAKTAPPANKESVQRKYSITTVDAWG